KKPTGRSPRVATPGLIALVGYGSGTAGTVGPASRRSGPRGPAGRRSHQTKQRQRTPIHHSSLMIPNPPRRQRRFSRWVPVAALRLSGAPAEAQSGYRRPPKEVLDILQAPPTPQVSVSPTRDRLLLLHAERYPGIAELAEPMLRLA